jgi:hypothetical protein
MAELSARRALIFLFGAEVVRKHDTLYSAARRGLSERAPKLNKKTSVDDIEKINSLYETYKTQQRITRQ